MPASYNNVVMRSETDNNERKGETMRATNQTMLSNGEWTEVTADRMEMTLDRAVRYNNGQYSRPTYATREAVTEALDAGVTIEIGTDWYSRLRRTPEPVATLEPEMVECDCGHRCSRESRMAASLGTSCPDCYDRMSD